MRLALAISMLALVALPLAAADTTLGVFNDTTYIKVEDERVENCHIDGEFTYHCDYVNATAYLADGNLTISNSFVWECSVSPGPDTCVMLVDATTYTGNELNVVILKGVATTGAGWDMTGGDSRVFLRIKYLGDEYASFESGA